MSDKEIKEKRCRRKAKILGYSVKISHATDYEEIHLIKNDDYTPVPFSLPSWPFADLENLENCLDLEWNKHED